MLYIMNKFNAFLITFRDLILKIKNLKNQYYK